MKLHRAAWAMAVGEFAQPGNDEGGRSRLVVYSAEASLGAAGGVW